jgi:hypothetical protein
MTTDHYHLGLTEAAEQFIGYRREWLADHGSVRLQETPPGGWDVVLRIDGTYSSRAHAQHVANQFQREVHGLAEAARRRRSDTTTTPVAELALAVRCPACKSVLGKSQAAVEVRCHGLRPGGGSSRRTINPIIAHLIMASLVSGSRS